MCEDFTGFVHIACTNPFCGTSQPTNTDTAAVDAWNRRAKEKEVPS